MPKPRPRRPDAGASTTTDTNAAGRERAANRLTLDATLAIRGDLRHTPAGIPAIEVTLHHQSVQPEAGGERKVECELVAVAFGPLAETLARTEAGSPLRCEGFLARRWRTGVTLALHLTNIARPRGH